MRRLFLLILASVLARPSALPAQGSQTAEIPTLQDSAYYAWITQLSEVAATVVYEGELGEWEDVRLHFLDENQAEIPGKVYGKVISVKPLGDQRHEAGIRFTSVSREIHQLISRTIGSA